ncbi:hypothetical protein J3F83DRAFT_748108 [Trichoderma novae-zelandiae]
MNALNSDKFVPTTVASPSPPPPLLPARPRAPELRRATRAAGATITLPGDSDSDGDGDGGGVDDLPPTYEASTLRRPSDAHVHITVRSSRHASNSASSLPSLIAGRAGRTSVNTQGYLLTTPMLPTPPSSTSSSSSRNLWGRNHHHTHNSSSNNNNNSNSRHDKDGSGCCFSQRGGCFFSDRDGCCCSDTGGCCFSSDGGACCSDGGASCCGSRVEGEAGGGGGEMAGVETTMERGWRFA